MPVKGLTKEEIDAATAAVVAAGGKSTDRANRLPGETATEANARITAAYKAQPKPELTQEGKEAGAVIKFVRTEAGGVGTYKEIWPMGTPIPAERTTAYGNTYDAKGNLISGSGLKPGVPGTTPAPTQTGQTPAGTATAGTATAGQTPANQTVTQVVGSSIDKWAKDPATGKERTPEEIIAAVTKAVLEDKSSTWGTTLDPLTGKPRPATDAQKVQIALAQLAATAKFESPRLLSAQKVSQFFNSGGAATALANRPELWALGKETVGTIIDRQNFGDAKSSKRFVVDPTTNQLTPDQLRQFNEIGASGGMAIDPITGFQVQIDSTGKYSLGNQGSTSGSGERSEVSRFQNGDGTVSVTYSDGTSITFSPGTSPTGDTSNADTPQGINMSDSFSAAGTAERQSAYDLLYSQFKQYGLGSLVEPLKGLIVSGASPAEFTIKLRESDAYKKRFAANASRIANGLAAISEAEYLGLEDQYQNIMRNYGLPQEYYTRGEMGTQEGFNKFIANDVSAAELEDRIMTAQNRVLKANPEVLASLKQFYPDINNGDILAYTLDPAKGLDSIKRKVTAAEIGGAATQAGLRTGMARAEELGAAGITKQQAQQGFGTIAGGLQRGSQLASIYGEDPYTQTTAEKEVFGLTGQTEAEKQRKKLTGLEKATFSGQAGLTSGALARDRAGAY
jgi:hypothetical protein